MVAVCLDWVLTMHRNAEIWAKRHDNLQRIKERVERNVSIAMRCGETNRYRSAIAMEHRRFLERWRRVEAHVWHAFCVAKCWRKA